MRAALLLKEHGLIASRPYPRWFAILPGKRNFASAAVIDGSEHAASSAVSLMLRSPARWWASSGRSPVQCSNLAGRRPEANKDRQKKRRAENTNTNLHLGTVCGVGGGTLPGSPRDFYERLTLAA